MATPSSAKKAAQVAARSSSSSKKGKNWLFPAAIVAIVVLGIAVVMFARDENVGIGDNDTPPLAQLTQGGAYDHWHSAFAVNVCGEELGPYSDVGTDILGIHAHPGEALIHVHPFSLKSSGERARMGHFFDQVGLQVTDTGFSTPDGNVYSEAETTCAGEPTELTMSYWKDPLGSSSTEPDEIFTEGFGALRFTEDRSAYSLALLPKGEVAGQPAGLSSLINPSDIGDTGGGSIPDFEVEDPTATTSAEGAETTAVEGADPAPEGDDGSTPEGDDGSTDPAVDPESETSTAEAGG